MNRILTILMIVLSTGTVHSEQLRMELKKGDRFQTVTKTEQTVVQQIGGQESRIANNTTVTMGFTVLARTDAELRIQMAFERIRFEQDTPMGRNIYDSSGDTQDTSPQLAQMAKIYGTLLNTPLTMIMDPVTGTQKRMDGWEQFVEAVVAEMGIQDQQQTEALSSLLKKSVQDQIMSNGSQGLFPPVFNRELAAGTTWTDRQTVSLMADMDLETRYTVMGMEGNRVKLDVQSTLSTPENAAPVDMGMMKLRYQLNGTQNGTMTLDKQTGWVMESTIHHTLDGSMESIVDPEPENAMAPGGQGIVIPLQVTGKTVMTSVRK